MENGDENEFVNELAWGISIEGLNKVMLEIKDIYFPQLDENSAFLIAENRKLRFVCLSKIKEEGKEDNELLNKIAEFPNSTQHKKPVDVYDGTTENRRVYEFEVDGKKKYIIEHREDKFGRGPHFHGADDLKGSPLEKGRYNQYPGHSPENFVGYKKKGRP